MNQFLKRKAKTLLDKAVEAVPLVAPSPEVSQEIDDMEEQGLEPIVGPAVAHVESSESVYTHIGLDVYSLNGGSSFGVAEIEYNPLTKEARVKDVFDVSRMVGLSYAPGKAALGTLKKKKQ